MTKYAGVLLASTVVVGGIASAAISPAFPSVSNTFATAGQVIKSADINKLAEAINNLDKRAFQIGTNAISFLKSDGTARAAGSEFTVTDDGKVGIGISSLSSPTNNSLTIARKESDVATLGNPALLITDGISGTDIHATSNAAYGIALEYTPGQSKGEAYISTHTDIGRPYLFIRGGSGPTENGHTRELITINTTNGDTTIHGSLKTIGGKNAYFKTYAEMNATSSSCMDMGTTFQSCIAAADTICYDLGYSGGTVTQDSGTAMKIVCMP